MKFLIALLILFPWSLVVILWIAFRKLVRRVQRQRALQSQPSPTYNDISQGVVPIDADHITWIGRA